MYKMTKQLTHGSLFSGIGGFELGAALSDIPTLWNCEINPWCREHLNYQFPNTSTHTDITTLKKPRYVDIISGGFPCQDISLANSSKNNKTKNGKILGINGKRSVLWTEMFRICKEVRPQYLLIENSPMLTSRGLEKILQDLSQIGYLCEWRIIAASQFGYNHQRKRFYGVAYPFEKRRKIRSEVFSYAQKAVLKPLPRQYPLSMPIKRFNSESNYKGVRVDDGFSKELDRKQIEGLGNAVVPEIAHFMFECIKHHFYNAK